MKIQIRNEVAFIIQALEKAGFEAFLVGGAVRDLILAQQNKLDPDEAVKDYDFATNATPDEIQQLFPESFYENEFGTVAITHQELLKQMGVPSAESILPKPHHPPKDRIIDLVQATKIHKSLGISKKIEQEKIKTVWLSDFEITTYRSGEVYADFRRPDPTKLVWGETINEDLKRRDFTINAMALKFIKKDEYELIDPFKGLDDLNQHFIKTVGDPTQRFKEDALRMLRAERFAVQLNMQISDQTFEAIINHGQLITKISWERISDEFLKILASQYPAEGIKLLDESGLLQFVLPEILQGKAVSQGGHHTTDVWTHSLDSIKECPNPDPIVRLATLLHDVAKPQTFAIRNDKITFYNHEIIGSRMADTIAKRFKLPNAQRKQLFTLVRYHMFYYQPHHTDAAIRRFMRKVGLENIDEILDLREADRLGSGARKTSWRLEEMKQRMVEQLNQPMEVTDLDINGYDLMKEFALKSGPWIGEVLNKLLEKVLDEPELNKKDELMTLAKELIKQN
ncbi:HDIG domain-containing protein [Patescibacteria group bacterium]|nr:HDIG domain-containing protein [Patescibacteria group bacterium]